MKCCRAFDDARPYCGPMLLLWWSLEQYAEAGQAYADRNGFLPMPSLDAAILVQDSWRRYRADEPTGRPVLFGVGEKPLARAWAARTFLKSAIECDPMGRH